MGVAQVRTAVRAHLAANWSATQVVHENDDYAPSTDADGTMIPWVYAEVYGGLYEQVSVGAGDARDNLWIASGQIVLTVFVASGTGADVASAYADQMAELFRGIELDPEIAFTDMQIAPGGGSADGNTWGVTLTIQWTQG